MCLGAADVPQVRLPLSTRLHVGQSVAFRSFRLNPFLAAVILFGLPMAGALLALVARWTLPLAWLQSVAEPIVALAGMACGYGLAVFSDHRIRASHPPRLVEDAAAGMARPQQGSRPAELRSLSVDL
jgi:hypothetical protein